MNKQPKKILSLKKPKLTLIFKAPTKGIPIGGYNPTKIAMNQRKQNSAKKSSNLT